MKITKNSFCLYGNRIPVKEEHKLALKELES